jgi:hypothetical protein
MSPSLYSIFWPNGAQDDGELILTILLTLTRFKGRNLSLVWREGSIGMAIVVRKEDDEEFWIQLHTIRQDWLSRWASSQQEEKISNFSSRRSSEEEDHIV